MWANTLCPLSSSTRNIALGRGSETVPSTSIASFFGMPPFVALPPDNLTPHQRVRVGDETNRPRRAAAGRVSIRTRRGGRPRSRNRWSGRLCRDRGRPGAGGSALRAEPPEPPPEGHEPQDGQEQDRDVRRVLEGVAAADGLALERLLVPLEVPGELRAGGDELRG